MMNTSETKLRLLIMISCVAAFMSAVFGGFSYYTVLKKDATVLAHEEAQEELERIGNHLAVCFRDCYFILIPENKTGDRSSIESRRAKPEIDSVSCRKPSKR